jgi:DNA-nicking Smr family endonuclease
MQPSRRTGLTEAERKLWADYASRVRTLPRRSDAAPSPSVVFSVPIPAHGATHAPRGLSQQAPLAIGNQPGGVDTASWQRFRTNRMPSARKLDLHGHTAQRAFHALTSFVRTAHAEGLRCVEVVTGQGGVLRRELPHWLNLPEVRSLVLAAAHPHPANPGLVRLLLRRAR